MHSNTDSDNFSWHINTNRSLNLDTEMLAKHIGTIFYRSHLNMLSYTGKITLVGGGEGGQSKGETI